MKKMQMISMWVLIVALLVMGINKFFFHLPDWVIRVDGFIMLIGIFTVFYSIARYYKERS
ncbi:hypothetical protein [Thomasclavelia sp.]